MLRSMTGYGRGEIRDEKKSCTVEVRSVNHRYLDVSVRLSKRLGDAESWVRKQIQDRFSRGRFDVFLNVELRDRPGKTFSADLTLAEQYVASLKAIQEKLHLPGTIEVGSLATVRDLFRIEETEEQINHIQEILAEPMNLALAALQDMREREGEVLCRQIMDRISSITETLGELQNRLPQVLTDYHSRLRERVRVLLNGANMDESRLHQEVALLAERSDVAEEMTRLRSHLQQFHTVIESDQTVGRTLEFLLQEMYREVNTISSKSSDLQISQYVVSIKSDLEKIREQIQNVE